MLTLDTLTRLVNRQSWGFGPYDGQVARQLGRSVTPLLFLSVT